MNRVSTRHPATRILRSAGDPRVRSTYDLIRRRLGQDGLLQRYEPGVDGLSGDEGAFGILMERRDDRCGHDDADAVDGRQFDPFRPRPHRGGRHRLFECRP